MNVLANSNTISRPLAVTTCRVYELVESRVRLLKIGFRGEYLKDGTGVFLLQTQCLFYVLCVVYSSDACLWDLKSVWPR